jgi:hypothetical protein
VSHRHRSIVDVHLVLRRDGKILMGRRANTGYGDGLLHLPSGHLERGESVIEAVIPYPAAAMVHAQQGTAFSLHGWGSGPAS